MQELKSDILIVGAGLTGLMTAYALSDLKIDIIVIDKFNFVSEKDNNFDIRTWEFFFYDQQIDQKSAPPSDFFPQSVLENSISPKISFY